MPGRTKKSKDAAVEDVSMADASGPDQVEDANDATMTDGAPFPNMEADEEDPGDEDALDAEFESQRVRILPGSIDSAASFEFLDEGHTLGNALRYIIMKNPNVEFCAYAIPHPSEPKMNLRIQTYEGTAVEALRKGLVDLQDVCDVIADKFWTCRDAFNTEKVMM